MKKVLFFLVFTVTVSSLKSQSCKEYMDYVKSNSYGSTFRSYNSEAISQVTFYKLTIDYTTRYFAIVCFNRKNSYGCVEYIYEVGPNTQYYYSTNYLTSAGKAFWKYIQPYNKVLGCAPNFDN